MPRESKDAGLASSDIRGRQLEWVSLVEIYYYFSFQELHSFDCKSDLQNNWDGGGKTNSVLLKVLSADQTDLLRNA